MEVILLQKINKLGNIGDTVEVKPGFGRNYLIPSGKALRATKENKEVFETSKAKLLEKNKDDIEKAEKVILVFSWTMIVTAVSLIGLSIWGL